MPLAAWAGAAAIRVLGLTWRIEKRDLDATEWRLAAGERCIFAFWHARLLPLTYTHRNRAIAVLVSRHRDGELIARIITRLGFATGRGSSTRGGEAGVRDMLALAEAGHLLAITPDGPRGPAERVKSGLVYLASRTGFPVVPVATAARGCWVFRSWDGFRVPRPWTRVVVAYGTPVAVPSELTAETTEHWRARLEAALSELTAQVAALAGETR
jgi:hypothetical protein